MKKLLLLGATLCTLGAFAQGTVNFNNSPSAVGSASGRVFDLDGVTPVGSAFVAQLYAGPVGGALLPIGAILPFRDGTGAGYINITGVDPARTITTVAPGAAADVQLRAWQSSAGATWEAAQAAGGKWGASPTLTLASTGGAGSPPGLPVNLVGLGTTVMVPEPSTIALGLLGAAALLIRRRK